MDDKPTLLERQSLGNLLEVLKQKGGQKWKTFITDYFEDWEPIQDGDISPSQYYSSLKNFPTSAKRQIIRGIMLGWNEHHDLLTLYECITTLIYLKVCDEVSYFFMQQIYNFMCKFDSVCESKEQIYIQCSRPWMYTLRFLKPGQSPMGDNYGIIDFELAKSGEDAVLAIVPWFCILNSYNNYSEDTEWDDNMIEDSIADDIYPLLQKEFAKTHCPWICSSYDFHYQRERFNRGIVIVLHSLQYADYNG